MVSFVRTGIGRLPPKLRRLQEVQSEIYRQLQLLIPDDVVLHDAFQSRVHGSPLLKMDILERHPYTHFLRLTYLKPYFSLPDLPYIPQYSPFIVFLLAFVGCIYLVGWMLKTVWNVKEVAK